MSNLSTKMQSLAMKATAIGLLSVNITKRFLRAWKSSKKCLTKTTHLALNPKKARWACSETVHLAQQDSSTNLRRKRRQVAFITKAKP